jgi:hypothetical protein
LPKILRQRITGKHNRIDSFFVTHTIIMCYRFKEFCTTLMTNTPENKFSWACIFRCATEYLSMDSS